MSEVVAKLSLLGDREVVMETWFAAPCEQVFQAFIDPDAIPVWWGPEEYVTTVDKMDVQVGGRWRFVQRAPGGKKFAFNGAYRELDVPHKIVQTFEFEGLPGHIIRETMLFEVSDAGTKLINTLLFDNQPDRDRMLRSGMEQGARESMSRLDRWLQAKTE